ncbi:MAG: dienelactone hydrolase family protein [Pseudomonadales bacterium]|nr:dienelactone hydrolase family protein [Pseudomonadales bacterium]
MLEHHIDIETRDGKMNTFITHPEEGGPHPVILFLMDAPGKREELHDMARRIATVGYYVILPNLYYRTTREFQLSRDEAGMKEMFKLMYTLSNPMVMQDISSMLAYAEGQSAARAGKIGVVGYCMSGPFAFAAAAQHADRVAVSASIYGAGLITDKPDSPHLEAAKISGEMYFACAEIDQYAPASQITELEQLLTEAKTNYRIEWYPGAEHGFAFPQREGIYHKASAERHWERLFRLFAHNL